MDRKARLKNIIRNITFLSQTKEDAYNVIQELMNEDWEKLVQSPYKLQEQECIFCQTSFPSRIGPTSGACNKCYPSYSTLISEVSGARTRALNHGLSATLTLRQWCEVVNIFHGKCAYCQTVDSRLKYGVLIEHYIPIDLGGGTTKENCVPACYTCNGKKRRLHPFDVLHLFPNGEIQRVQVYIDGVIKAHQSAKTHLIASEEVERFIVERRKPGQPKKGQS